MASDVAVDSESNECGCAGELAWQAVLLGDELLIACEEGGEWLWGVESGDWWHDWSTHCVYIVVVEVVEVEMEYWMFVDSWQWKTDGAGVVEVNPQGDATNKYVGTCLRECRCGRFMSNPTSP